MAKKKKVIGLLGGIGAGKSTVAECFARLGCGVIDADEAAHGVLEESEVKEAVVLLFGPRILDALGRVDRAALGRIVFGDGEALERLNGLIHPRVMAEVERRIGEYQTAEGVKAVVLDVPLLAEAGGTELCDALIFVEAEEAIRRERVRKSGKFDVDELKKRENFQISLDTKREIADYIIRNNSGNSDVAEQVAQLFSIITGKR